eukprot:261887-Chlamydomonas_euryale.AAC.1
MADQEAWQIRKHGRLGSMADQEAWQIRKRVHKGLIPCPVLCPVLSQAKHINTYILGVEAMCVSSHKCIATEGPHGASPSPKERMRKWPPRKGLQGLQG